jgi:hypothetical protein
VTDAIERARELLRRIEDQMSGVPFQRSDAQILCEQHSAALDCLEVLRGDLKYPSLNKHHAEAWEKFEEATK